MSSFELTIRKSGRDMLHSWRTYERNEERFSYSLACMKVDSVRIHTVDDLLQLMVVLAELNQITGIAAILTFPLDIEVVEAEEREAKEEEERRKKEANEEA
jgi:hypothetical protein